MDIYAWKVNGLYKADPTKVHDEIANIKDITPENIVIRAKDKKSELHKCFEWDDTKAAAKYRVWQARNICANLIVITRDADPVQEPRAFYVAGSSESYQPVQRILQNEDSYQKLLKRAMAELKSFKQKYSMLKELQQIFDLIE